MRAFVFPVRSLVQLGPAVKRWSSICPEAQLLVGESQLHAFDEHGWCIPSHRLPQATLEELRTALNQLAVSNPDVRPEEYVNAHLEGGKGSHIRGSSVFLQHGCDASMTGIAAALLQKSSVILWGCHIFCKPPGTGRAVPFHQDAPYWPIEPMEALTLWVALDDSDKGNACLQVLSGSHRCGALAHEEIENDAEEVALGTGVKRELLEGLPKPSVVELRAGQLSAHSCMLVHGSDANHSQRRRAGITYLYMAADSHFNRVGLKPASKGFGYESRPLFWVRGDHCHPRNSLVTDWRPCLAVM